MSADREQLGQLIADAVPRGVRVVEGYRTHFREPTPDEVAAAVLPVVEAHTRAAQRQALMDAYAEASAAGLMNGEARRRFAAHADQYLPALCTHEGDVDV